MDESEQAVFSISERTSGKVFKSSKELVNRVFEELTKRFEQKEAVMASPQATTALIR
ncbi:MAG: hypothetical protein ACLT2T_08990 [Bilophila wadsworthia]